MIMQNQEAMHQACENGKEDVFSFEEVIFLYPTEWILLIDFISYALFSLFQFLQGSDFNSLKQLFELSNINHLNFREFKVF